MEGHIFTTQYQYDQNGNVKKLIYPNGRQITYTLNQANQITQVDSFVEGNPQTLAQTITYAPFGPLKTYTAGNGLSISNSYDTDYQLTDLQAGSIMNRHYEYDRNGNVQSISNLPTPTLTPEAMNYSYQNNNNQLTQAINGTSTTYSYNAAGNLITEVKNGITRTYTYNYSQRLTSVTENSITLGEYTYDALGRRTKKVAGGTTTLYIYDQTGLLIAEYTGDGTWQRDYLYLNGQPLAMIVASSPENGYYYHNDHLGTPQLMTDSAGAVVWSATYEPFGKATITIEQVTNNLRLPGQYFDAETGLHYNWHRDYDNELGRYIESDPIGLEGGINLYTYVANKPTFYIDPAGLWIPYRHGQFTFKAASEAGCSINGANKLAVETAKVDFRDGSNLPENAYWHGMVDGRINGDPAKSIREYVKIQREAFHTCDIKDIALALHALQDTYAPAHGFKPWDNSLSAWLKHYSDWSDPSDSTSKNIDNLSRSLIENARRRCPCLCN